jgi:hypothetical protein
MTSAQSRSYDLLWLSPAPLVLLPVALLLAITPHDYWFYVRMGRDILESGAIPRVDTFSYTYHPESPLKEMNPTFNYILAGLILLPGIRESWWTAAPAPYHEASTPIAAMKWLTDHPDLKGPLFAEYRWDKLLDADKVNLLMLSLSTQQKLVWAVEDSRDWCEQYRDETAVIFSRCEPMR